MEAMLQEVSGVVPFQHVRVGPEPIVVNLRFDQVQRDRMRSLAYRLSRKCWRNLPMRF
jgi:hypothetical protein